MTVTWGPCALLVVTALFYVSGDYGWHYGHEDSQTVHPSWLAIYQRWQHHKWGNKWAGSTESKTRLYQLCGFLGCS